MRHFHNPYETALDVTLDEIIELSCTYNREPNPKARAGRMRDWLSQFNKLDCYLLPSPSGMHDLGARYGDVDRQYVCFPVEWDDQLNQLYEKAKIRAG